MRWFWVKAMVPAAVLLLVGEAHGQGPNLPPGGRAAGGSVEGSLLGPSPGALPGGAGRGEGDAVLGGRPGPSVPRVPSSITRPDSRGSAAAREGIAAPDALPLANVPLFGPLSIPGDREDEGPAGGLTLDEAIDRLVRDNLALRARQLELPQAEADILTAGLRANPLIYADSQLIPYGGYSEKRAGGPTQYDVNVTQPLDLTRKRRARTVAATRAKRVLEAQYQDAVRLQIDNLYTAFADVLAARETIRFAEAAREGLNILLDRTRRMYEGGSRTIADVSRLESIAEGAEVELLDAEEALRSTRRSLGTLLGRPGPEAEALEVRGSIRDAFDPPPPVDQLVAIALSCRPDVVAYRLGIARAEAEVSLARANRLSDVYLLYQPYTFQNNAPFDTKSAHSWAIGVTVPLPVFDRNQGNIEKARINVGQTKIELADRELEVAGEVRRAEREYAVTRTALGRVEGRLIPAAARVRDDAYRLYLRGEGDATVYLNAQREYNEAARQYRDLLVRHRRAMLRLNTAVGRRLLP